MHRTHNPTICAADTDDLPEVVTPADTLRGAARYLELHGWLQHSHYHPPRDGQRFPAACADGAIGMAAYGGVTACPGRENDHPAFRDYNRAFHHFNGYLQQLGWTPPCDPWCPGGTDCVCGNDKDEIVFGWNDDDTRTAADVIAALRSAADDYDWQHAAPDDLETYEDSCVWAETHPTREGFIAWLAAHR
jgi:hypothetical protein